MLSLDSDQTKKQQKKPTYIWAETFPNLPLTCAPNEDSDQPAHLRILIRICIKRI